MDYRQQFKKDVVVDIICFRKLGHNEQDTPSPHPAADVQEDRGQHPGTRKLYGEKLVAQGVLQADGANSPDGMVKAYRAAMDEGKSHRGPGADQLQEQVRRRLGAFPWQEVDRRGRHRTAAGRGEAPEQNVSPRCPPPSRCTRSWRRCYADRAAMGRGEINVDWGMGETLAYASLVASGYAVRLSGRRLRPRHLRAPPRRACTTRTARSGTPAPTYPCRTWPTARRPSSSSTRCCRKKRCWASSTAMPPPSPTR